MICILESRDAYSVTVEDGFHLYQSQTDETLLFNKELPITRASPPEA